MFSIRKKSQSRKTFAMFEFCSRRGVRFEEVQKKKRFEYELKEYELWKAREIILNPSKQRFPYLVGIFLINHWNLCDENLE